ncbi:histidine phosphatase family protein [Deinococcus radiophilus]|uniref:Histidine phosphatase family protein n=1 Tax=Deinococcus radiophilus TaxID=32062 RepID=A0A431VQ63_9DEIO|nr:histidine phosphatase family protein [Deinococcus radiophilus]RTR25329.1 histidine phosphatase family protein [Deinococcus radiophilus]UFA50471.1 histidine phosphatase family protein [Deinococcus radiophilus]
MTESGTLILARHGRTALNAAGRFQGQTQTPLDELGRAQAQALAAQLYTDGVRKPAIYSSDLPRAIQTAQAVQERLGGTLHTDAALREIEFGSWDQQSISGIEEQFPDDYWRFRGGDPSFVCPGGECGHDVVARAYGYLQAHLPGPGETAVVVAHQLTIFALLTRLLDEDYQTVWPTRRFNHANAAFSRLTYQGGAVVNAELALSEHLAGLE